ncbi:LPS-assembly protein LptD [Stieleria varia]|uniref:LPS-assembly protein LptD n=1 Tax=Stieleria varia TaxID=2528005 RepID=A0A5C6BAB3_9BACT|nr:organic solvent tolerance protein OstA [Stieleria varia]TWU08219.1 hypothetical protein Pla52n_08010 [Stieleria varia]
MSQQLAAPQLAAEQPHSPADLRPVPSRSAVPEAAVGQPIAAGATTVHRWQVGDAQISWLVGESWLIHGANRFSADSILIVTDGPRSRVRNRVVLERARLESGDVILADPKNADPTHANPTPVAYTWYTNDEPSVQAPNYRGKPDQSPFLMQFLPPQPASRSQVPQNHPVAQVQFTQPVPDPNFSPPEFSNPEFSAPAVTIPQDGMILDANDGAATFTDPTFTVPQPFVAPQNGLPLAVEPEFPTVYPDGATTGGMPFFFGGGTKAVVVSKRGSTETPEITNTFIPETGENIMVARGGVTVRIDDVAAQLPSGEIMNFGTVTLSADRIVGWFPPIREMLRGGEGISGGEGELYLEGDIVFRQGERIIYAESMYYNVVRETGMVLNAEAITTVPEFEGVVRLKADVLQQVASGNFVAFDAAITTSRLGVPRYWLQSEQLRLTQRMETGVDERTGRPTISREPFVTSDNNFVFISGVPLLYWPRFSTRLERPAFYLTDVKINNDNAFGTQVMLEWDLFQLFGFNNPPKGVDWRLSTDYLSDRGPAVGTSLDYTLPGLLGLPGPVRGMFDAWVIDDDGNDRLGQGRLDLPPEETVRGRALMRHRHYLPADFELIGELGWISDRNFLEQYLEQEWDQDVDHRTALRLRKYHHNQMIDLSASVQTNDFFAMTEDLPRLDHYLLGASILGDRVTWSMNNRVGYQRLNPAAAPTNPAEAATYFPLPGEVDRQGIVASTRQQLSTTIPVGPVNVRPIASFEAAHYGEAADGDSLTRLLGQGGVTMSMQMQRIDPTIQSSLLNLRGIAHRLEWTAEYWYADSDTNLDELPLYDPLDDDSQEQFRRRFIGDLFGGTLPDQFDPRLHALRQNTQRWVTGPSDVIADDLQQFRVGLNQRFQTKRGLPGRERIVDFLQLDMQTTFFANENDVNFGESIGPTTYDARYHIGDRFSLLSDGYFEWFDNGLRSVSAGIRSSRPGIGDWYVGLMSLEGPISSTVARSSVDYRMNEKWIFSGGTTYDFGATGNVGQSFGLTRIGESALIRLSVNVDSGRDNVGFKFLIEPRFFARNLGRIGGGLIPPPGLEGLE